MPDTAQSGLIRGGGGATIVEMVEKPRICGLPAVWGGGGFDRGEVRGGNSIAFGKSTSQRIYREQHTPKIGWKLHKYRLKHALHTLNDHFR